MKKIILLLILSICTATSIFASKIFASSFGYSSTNASSAFQQAIESPADTTVIDFVGTGEWNVNPHIFFNLLNKTIIFEKGVKLIAKAGYGPTDCLLQIKYGTNVKIIGNNTLLKMPRAEYTGDRSRMGLSIIDCANIEVSNLNITDSGEDGIFISAYGGGGIRPTEFFSKNIILRNIICDNNRRQGLSIISAQNLLVEHCIFKNTNGTLPEGGVDMEPDFDYERLENINFKKCSFIGNYGSGIQLTSLNLKSTSVPISITFDDCFTSQNKQPNHGYVDGEIYLASPKTNQATGSCTFNRCLVANSQYSAAYIAKSTNGYAAIFNDCVFKNVSQVGTPYKCPIWFENLNYDVGVANDPVGGAAFNNLLVQYNVNLPLVGSYGSPFSAGLKNITGNINVQNAMVNNTTITPSYTGVPTFNNVSFGYDLLNTLPENTISVNSERSSMYESNCNKNIFTYARSGTSFLPLPIIYTLTGTATNVEDYLHMPSFMIIPTGESVFKDTIIAFDDFFAEPNETIVLNTTLQNNYSNGNPNNFTTTIINGNGLCNTLASNKIIFTGKKQQANTVLNFSIATNILTTNYYIERSDDGIKFNDIGKLNFVNNIGDYANYIFVDTKSQKSKHYYRVYYFDNNEKKYSEIIVLLFNEKGILISPNPINETLHFYTNLKIKKIQIFDVASKLVQNFNPSTNVLDVSILPKGILIAKFFDDDNNILIKQIIKL